MKRITTQRIIEVAAEVCGVSVDRLKSSDGSNKVMTARLISAEVNRLLDKPDNDIADEFGVDVTKIGVYVGLAEAYLKDDPYFALKEGAVRRVLQLRPVAKDEQAIEKPRKKKNFFTEEEEKAMAKACRDAVRYMEKYGKGQKPYNGENYYIGKPYLI